MQFFSALLQPSYYRDILTGNAPARAWLRLLLLTLTTALPVIIFVYTKGLTIPDRIEPDLKTIVDRIYPAELEVTIQSGKATTNVAEPYYLLVSRQDLAGTIFEDPNNKTTYSTRLLTIDTTATLADYDAYQTYFLLTSENLIHSDEGQTQASSLSQIQDIVISKPFITQSLDQIFREYDIASYLRIAIYAAGPALILGIFLMLIIKFALLAIVGLVIKSILGANTTYRRIWRTLICLAFIPDLFFSLLNSIPNLPDWISVIQSSIMLFIFAALYYLLKQIPIKVPTPKPRYD